MPEPVRVHAGDAGGAADVGDDTADDVPVQRAAVVGDQALAAADVLQVGRGPGGEQLCELGVQRDVAVVAELSQSVTSASGKDVSNCRNNRTR